MKYLLFYLLVTPAFLFAQKGTHYIELKKDSFPIENRNFYISEIIDDREDKTNIGISQKGLLNKDV